MLDLLSGGAGVLVSGWGAYARRWGRTENVMKEDGKKSETKGKTNRSYCFVGGLLVLIVPQDHCGFVLICIHNVTVFIGILRPLVFCQDLVSMLRQLNCNIKSFWPFFIDSSRVWGLMSGPKPNLKCISLAHFLIDQLLDVTNSFWVIGAGSVLG